KLLVGQFERPLTGLIRAPANQASVGEQRVIVSLSRAAGDADNVAQAVGNTERRRADHGSLAGKGITHVTARGDGHCVGCSDSAERIPRTDASVTLQRDAVAGPGSDGPHLAAV